MLHLLLQTLLVAGILTVLVLIVGPVFRLSPAVRYGLWLVVLIKLLAPPVVDWPWDATAVVGEAVTLLVFIQPAEAPVTPVQVVCEGQGLTVWTSCGLRVASLLWIVWALGSLVVFVTLTRRILRFRQVLSRSYPAPDHIVDIVEGVGRQLGIPAPPVRVVSGSSGPCVWSLGRPVVVIPEAMLANEDVAFWQYVLSHELAHIRRRDHSFVWLEFAGFVLWWWNPLFWLVGHRLRSNAEMAADNWVVSLNPDNRRQYAEALLWVAERGSRVGPAMPALGASRRSQTQFAKRLTQILVGDHGVRVSMPGMLGLLFLMLVVWPAWGVREVLPELVEATMATQDGGAQVLESVFELHQNYPNPFGFGQTTTIPFELHDALFSGDDTVLVSIAAYQLLGHVNGERVIVDRLGFTQPGTYEAHWDGTDATGRAVNSGVYAIELNVEGSGTLTGKAYKTREDFVAGPSPIDPEESS